MTENEKKEIIYLAFKDLYKEFNSSVNHLLIIREFWQDLLNIRDGKETVYEYPNVLKYSKFKQK